MKTRLLSVRQLDSYVLLLAILVVGAIFTIRYITSKNIDILQGSNRNTNNSFEVKNKVQKIISDVLIMDAAQNGILLGNGDTITSVQKIFNKTETDLEQLQPLLDKNLEKEYSQLASFVKRKINFTRIVLNTYHEKGLTEAEGMLNTGISEMLRDNIFVYARQLESVYTTNVQVNLETNFQNSKKLHNILSILSFISIFAIVALSALVIYRITQKNQLIRILKEVNKSEAAAVRELEAAKLAAEDSARIKEQFLANMSHEIRTPIGAVLGFSNFLQKTQLTDEQKKFVSFIQTSGSSLLSIVNDILDISKMEAGMMRIEKINFNLQEVCDGVMNLFESSARDKKLYLSLQIDELSPHLLVGDSLRLTQVLTNLVGNAVKFTTQGGVLIRVVPFKRSANECWLRFSVVDTGIGMAEEKLGKVFQRFDQGENDTTRRFGGTGLGLAIAKNLVGLQGGNMSVESRQGVGSTFSFELPFALQAEARDIRSENVAPQIEFPSGTRVLVVDDNEVNQMMVEYLMTEWKLDHKCAGNGKKAIELLKKESFDLVLMDIQMPEMDGYTASQKIKKEINAYIPIIAMTAHALPGEQEKCRSFGMDGYISKPLNESELKSLIHQHLPTKAAVIAPEKRFIDDAYIQHKFSGNQAFIEKIITKVRDSYPVELAVLIQAVAERNASATEEAAHKMCSTVSILHEKPLLLEWLRNLQNLASTLPVQWVSVDDLLEKLVKAEKQLAEEAAAYVRSHELVPSQQKA